MNSRDTDKFSFGLGSTKSCSLLFQYQLGFISIFGLVFNIHGMQVFYFLVVLSDDIGNLYVSRSALIAIFLVKKLIYQNELDYIILFFLLHKVAELFCRRINPNTIPANFFTFIGVTFFILRVPRFFVGSDNIRRCPKTFRRFLKTLRRVPSNTNMGTQRNVDFPTKNREFGESRSST